MKRVHLIFVLWFFSLSAQGQFRPPNKGEKQLLPDIGILSLPGNSPNINFGVRLRSYKNERESRRFSATLSFVETNFGSSINKSYSFSHINFLYGREFHVIIRENGSLYLGPFGGVGMDLDPKIFLLCFGVWGGRDFYLSRTTFFSPEIGIGGYLFNQSSRVATNLNIPPGTLGLFGMHFKFTIMHLF